MATDPFHGRDSISAAEYRSWLTETGQDAPSGSPMTPIASQPKRRATVDSGALQGIRESAFRDTVVAHARYRGWKVHWTWQSKHSPKGWPDLFMVRGDRLVAAEIKVGKNKPTADQRAWLQALAVAGVETYVWFPEHWDQLEEILA